MSKTQDEALARLEHKLDITLDLVMEIVGRVYGIRNNAIPKMGDQSHTCPVCKESVKYIIDVQDRSVSAKCGCKTGKYAPLDLEQFTPPRAAGGNYGRDEEGSGNRGSADEGVAPVGEQRPGRPRTR